MKRGNLILYDNTGRIFLQTGEAQGDVLPHEYPVGIPYIEIPFGVMRNKIIIGVDVSTNPHNLIVEDIPHVETEEERLQRELLEAQEQIVNLEYEKLIGGI